MVISSLNVFKFVFAWFAYIIAKHLICISKMLFCFMPLLIFRPLFIAITEYVLAIRVFRKGKFLPLVTFMFLFFLATYQFGEFLFFVNDGNRFWLAVSLFSTTMLPAYGLLFIEKLSHRKTFYIIFFIASLIFALSFFIFPSTIPETRECNCFLKFNRESLSPFGMNFFDAWSFYYFLSLTYSVLLISWDLLKHHGDQKNLKLLLIGYICFFPVALIVTRFTTYDFSMIASIMCTFAIATAFLISHISITKMNKKSMRR